MKQILTIFFSFLLLNAWGRTIPVGPQEAVKTVKAGVEAAGSGDTVLVRKGIYKEANLLITKPVYLIGEQGAVLDGEDKHEILTISGQDVVVKGLTFRNAGYSSMSDFAAIKVIDASFILLEGNTIEKSYFAIHIANASYGVVQNNVISGLNKTEQMSGNGIHLWKCDNMLVKGNRVDSHRDGIYFEFVTNSVIDGNLSEKNIRYGLHFMFSNDDSYINNTFRDNGAGVAVMYSRRVVMAQNRFIHNWGSSAYGLLLKEISDGQIILNEFTENTVGILMESTNRIEVRNNQFQNSGYALRIQASCNENNVHHNSFVANTFDVATNGSLMLNRFYNNYWDKYDGYDLNKDGIGDVAYHPVSMYSMVIEQNANAAILMRSFMVTLLDKAEKAIPSLTPEEMADKSPVMKRSLL